jgi:hypothetical protein
MKISFDDFSSLEISLVDGKIVVIQSARDPLNKNRLQITTTQITKEQFDGIVAEINGGIK